MATNASPATNEWGITLEDDAGESEQPKAAVVETKGESLADLMASMKKLQSK